MHANSMRCDLLENTYLCGSNNNNSEKINAGIDVVICLKIRTFVVATTTMSVSKILNFVL